MVLFSFTLPSCLLAYWCRASLFLYFFVLGSTVLLLAVLNRSVLADAPSVGDVLPPLLNQNVEKPIDGYWEFAVTGQFSGDEKLFAVLENLNSGLSSEPFEYPIHEFVPAEDSTGFSRVVVQVGPLQGKPRARFLLVNKDGFSEERFIDFIGAKNANTIAWNHDSERYVTYDYQDTWRTHAGVTRPGTQMLIEPNHAEVFTYEFHPADGGPSVRYDINPMQHCGQIHVSATIDGKTFQPITGAGVEAKNGNGGTLSTSTLSGSCVHIGTYLVGLNVRVVSEITIGGVKRKLSTTYLPNGQTLRVRVQGDSAEVQNNFSAFQTGKSYDPSGINPEPIHQKIFNLVSDSVHTTRGNTETIAFSVTPDPVLSNHTELTNPVYTVPSAGSNNSTYTLKYKELFGPSPAMYAAPLDETFNITVSEKLRYTFPWRSYKLNPGIREDLFKRVIVLLAQSPVDFDQFGQFIKKLGEWQVTDIIAWTFFGWTSHQPPGTLQHDGPSWMPATNPSGQSFFTSVASSIGALSGVYNKIDNIGEDHSQYSTDFVAHYSDGSKKPNWNNFRLNSEGQEFFMVNEAKQEAEAGHSMIFYDVETYGPITASGGPPHEASRLDMRAASGAANTSREAHLSWYSTLKQVSEIIGPIFGEGGIATPNRAFECDHPIYAHERVFNNAKGKMASEYPLGSTDAPTEWYSLFQWVQLWVEHCDGLANGNGHYSRFFSPTGIQDALGEYTESIYPLPRELIDMWVFYTLAGRGIPAFQTNAVPNFSGQGDYQAVRWFMRLYSLRSVSRRYLENAYESIRYLHQGSLKTLEELLFEGVSLEALRRPKFVVRYTSKKGEGDYYLYFNRDDSPWSVQVGGMDFEIPKLGWVAFQEASQSNPAFLALSAVPKSECTLADCQFPSTLVNNRIDFVHDLRYQQYFTDTHGVPVLDSQTSGLLYLDEVESTITKENAPFGVIYTVPF